MSNGRFITAIFCDDIRQELGNKTSLMGIYQNCLYTPNFPAILPKLCIMASVTTPSSTPFNSLTFRVLKDEQIIAELEVPASTLANPAKSVTNNEDKKSEPLLLMATAALTLSPLVIEKPCRLRVRAQADSEELKAPALMIDKSPNPN